MGPVLSINFSAETAPCSPPPISPPPPTSSRWWRPSTWVPPTPGSPPSSSSPGGVSSRRHLLGNAQVQGEQGGGGRDPRIQRAHEAHLGRAGGRREGQGQQGGDGEARKAVPLRL